MKKQTGKVARLELTQRDLARIRAWPAKDFIGMMEFISELWIRRSKRDVMAKNPEFLQRGSTYVLETGGFMDNELIVQAMNDNRLFWTMCWLEAKRGGFYKFNIHDYPGTPEEEKDNARSEKTPTTRRR